MEVDREKVHGGIGIMDLQDLKKLTQELKKLAGMLGQVKEKKNRHQIHRRAFVILRKIERGGKND